MNKKQRISHFTTRSIEVNEITRPQPEITKNIVKNKPTSRLNPASQVNQANRVKRIGKPEKKPVGVKLERLLLKTEADYASNPKKRHSEIVQAIIDQEVARFRSIK